MSGNGGSSVGTFLFSIPLAAIPLMAIFGIPQFAPLGASPERSEGYNDDERRPDDRFPEDRGYRQRATDLLRSRGFDAQSASADRGLTDRDDSREPHYLDVNERPERSQALLSGAGVADAYVEPRGGGQDAPPFYGNEQRSDQQRMELIEPQTAEDDSTIATNADGLTWQSAAQHLEDLGITSYHLEPGSELGSFLFVCSFRPAASSNVTMRFEAESTQPLDAVDDVLAQIDRWQQQQAR